jgi:glyoxylase-like metal-dependent hydrolase (beta-lactamase superfamily II)
MCLPAVQMPFTVDHVCAMVRRVYAGRVVFHDGSGQVAPGVHVHRLGGHSRGLQVVEVETENGPLVLASDAAHYWENYLTGKLFPIVVDAVDMAKGFATLLRLGKNDPGRIIPGHDPLVRAHYPLSGAAAHIIRLDKGPIKPLPTTY